jgi:ketosteroid isomerase-like protein
LYEDNAVVIWPGQGEYAIGKPAFRKILQHYCSGGVKQSYKVISSGARRVGPDYILHFGQLDITTQGPDGQPATVRVRTDELLHKSGGKWRYAVDHASVGLPPPGK